MRTEEGQALPLVLGLALLTFAVAGLAVDGTRAFLFRRTLQSAADAAALAGASEIDTTRFYASGGRVRVLSDEAARRAARRSLQLRALGASSVVTADERGVSVALRDSLPTTFLGIVGIGRLPVAVTARAERR